MLLHSSAPGSKPSRGATFLCVRPNCTGPETVVPVRAPGDAVARTRFSTSIHTEVEVPATIGLSLSSMAVTTKFGTPLAVLRRISERYRTRRPGFAYYTRVSGSRVTKPAPPDGRTLKFEVAHGENGFRPILTVRQDAQRLFEPKTTHDANSRWAVKPSG